MLNFDGMTQDEALAVAQHTTETIARRRRLGRIEHHEAKAARDSIWLAFEDAFPQDETWERPKPAELTHEQAQIEKIAASIWGMFHARHGGEFAPSGSIAADMTMAAADRAWAIAQAPEPMSLSLMSALMGDLDEHAHAGRWDYLSEVYASLNPTRMSSEEMVVYLRTLYTARDKITSYRDLLARCRKALERRGDGHEASLRGLDD